MILRETLKVMMYLKTHRMMHKHLIHKYCWYLQYNNKVIMGSSITNPDIIQGYIM